MSKQELALGSHQVSAEKYRSIDRNNKDLEPLSRIKMHRTNSNMDSQAYEDNKTFT